MPRDRAALVDPGQWWNEQRIVSRGLADQGNFKAAYRVAASNVAVSPQDVGEAEFHAGWYALRGLRDGATAEDHFRKILQISSGPISVSRAWYWLGRAAEAGGPGKAADFYAKAGALPSTFYGQLANERVGRRTLNVTYPSPTTEDRQRFQSREAVMAISRLEAAGNGWRADSLYRALAQQLQSPGEIAILAARAEKSGNHQLSLQVGKIAYGRGIDVAALAFPIGVIPDNANIAGSGKALAYAIARQESAFNPQAVSAANARGLLQLLPKTAKAVASRHGIAYSKDRLTDDAGYNATLGAHYLGEQIDTFGGSYILTFVAYNAGPNKVPEWIDRYGDPRGKSIDEVVDWIERIPFPETRNYVQRVMENYQVYKARLGQKTDIEQDLIHGRG
jgi:soluble lytic murein transglycosylase